MGKFWTEEKINELIKLWNEGLSGTQIAERWGIKRNMILGKVFRLRNAGIVFEARPQSSKKTMEELNRTRRERRFTPEYRAQRRIYAAKYYHEVGKFRQKQKPRKSSKDIFVQLRPGTSKYSAAFRKHLPRIPEMSKSDLRAMLAEAVRNTGHGHHQ